MKKSCKSANQEHPKNCEDFGNTKNEYSKGLKRLYNGRNYVLRPRRKLFGKKHLKRWKIGGTEHGQQYHAPSCASNHNN